MKTLLPPAVKAIFIDVDGTLIRKDHSLSQATINIVQKLKAAGIIVTLVSARPYSGIVPIAAALGLEAYPIASLNGAYIVAKDKIIFASPVSVADTIAVQKVLANFTGSIIYYQQDNWYAVLQDDNTDHEQLITHIPVIIQPFENIVSDFEKNTGPNKILFIADEATTAAAQDALNAAFRNELNIATSKPTYLEIMNKEASKQAALDHFIKYYNVPLAETIAIGDNFNDVGMIAHAGFGIAMGNAPEAVKAVAKYTTDTNENDGVANAIRYVLGW